jgi:hypothetical protein
MYMSNAFHIIGNSFHLMHFYFIGLSGPCLGFMKFCAFDDIYAAFFLKSTSMLLCVLFFRYTVQCFTMEKELQ